MISIFFIKYYLIPTSLLFSSYLLPDFTNTCQFLLFIPFSIRFYWLFTSFHQCLLISISAYQFPLFIPFLLDFTGFLPVSISTYQFPFLIHFLFNSTGFLTVFIFYFISH